MKTRLITAVCAVALSLLCVTPAQAEDRDSVAVATDALLVRPLCFVATIVGSAVFVVALPVAATSGSIDATADLLVKKPIWATFKRPVGDFGYAAEFTRSQGEKGAQRLIARAPQSKAKTARQ